MGAKYMPTARDLKAAKRYQEKQARLAREKKLSSPAPTRTTAKR
jgi:hypothetical protein